jgi:hypothetical protein
LPSSWIHCPDPRQVDGPRHVTSVPPFEEGKSGLSPPIWPPNPPWCCCPETCHLLGGGRDRRPGVAPLSRRWGRKTQGHGPEKEGHA